MNNTAIKYLIEQYFEGETSLQEEQQLRTYFQQGEVAEELKEYQPLFQYFATAKQEELPSGFEEQPQHMATQKLRRVHVGITMFGNMRTTAQCNKTACKEKHAQQLKWQEPKHEPQ